MLFRTLILFSALVVTGVAADTADIIATIRQSAAIRVYSLHPASNHEALVDEHGNRVDEFKGIPQFRGYPIHGFVDKLTSTEIRSLQRSLSETVTVPDEDRAPSMCFSPRHGVCLKTKDRHIDLVICFQCKQAIVYHETVHSDGVTARQFSISITDDALGTLNAILDSRKIMRDLPPR